MRKLIYVTTNTTPSFVANYQTPGNTSVLAGSQWWQPFFSSVMAPAVSFRLWRLRPQGLLITQGKAQRLIFSS